MLLKDYEQKFLKPPYHPTAVVALSGSTLIMGELREKEGDAFFIHTDEMAEPIFFSKAEAAMLIGVLEAMIEEDT